MLHPPDDESSLGESRVRQIIGDFAHSTSTVSPFLREMRKTFDGQQRSITSESRFLSTYGWSALTFTDPDLQGTYVLGIPDLFQIEIPTPADDEDVQQDGDEDQQDSVVQKTWGRLRGFFKREEAEPNPEGDSVSEEQSPPEDENEHPLDEGESSEDESHSNIFRRLGTRVTSLVRREKTVEMESSDPEEPLIEPTRLVFAYSPDEQPLFDEAGYPALPENLIPLSSLAFTEHIRPEAKGAIEIFTDAGVQVKIISQQNARESVAAARQLGLEENQPEGLKTLSGTDIETMRPEYFPQAVREATVFAPVTTQQKGKIIELLRDSGEYVAMTGEGINDIEAMRQANLSITIQGGTQAAVSFADIILLKDSLQALPKVLHQGRRIVNGLMDVLKLNLVQVVYIFFLLIAMIVFKNKVFFYDPTQGGVIVFFTIVIPSVGLTFWATSGAISEKRMLSQLMRFIIPVGLTSALASLVVYYVFEYLTGDSFYAQLGVTFTLTLTGMLMVLFIKPPNKFWVGDNKLSGDKRFVWMVLVMFILFGIVLVVPIAQELLKVAPLRQVDHYLIIGGIVLIWAVLTKLIWLLPGMRINEG